MYGPKPIRIDAQKFGNVILVARIEKPGSRVPVLPHPFCWSQSHQLATSRYQLEGSKSCHRIVRYGFGGIEIMVRFESESATEATPSGVCTNDDSTGDNNGVGTLTTAMRATSVHEDIFPLLECTAIESGIKIHKTQYPPPPLSSLIETKTRSAKGELDYVDIYGQFVFSQTQIFSSRGTAEGISRLWKRSLLEKGYLRISRKLPRRPWPRRRV